MSLFSDHDPSRPCDWCDAKKTVTNLDGEDLCQKCADKWVQGEGEAAAERDREA